MKAIGIVASTGGPQALARLLSKLPRGFDVPVLVAQHLVDGSTHAFVRSIAGRTALPVLIAAPGDRLLPAVYVAPDGCHLGIDRAGRLDVHPNGDWSHSGDRLLESLAATCGAGACGVVLTGLGDDGAQGLEAVRAAGGLTITQDAATALASPMPASARPAAQHVARLEQISSLLLQHFGGHR